MRPREERPPTQFDSVFPISSPVPCLHVLFLNTLIVLLPLPPFLTPHLNVTLPCPLVSSLWSLWTLPQPVPVLPGPFLGPAFAVGTNKCRVNNGGCSSLCLATPGSRQCACAEDQVLDTDGVTCLGMRCPTGLGGLGAVLSGRGPKCPIRNERGKGGPVGATGGKGWGERRPWRPGGGSGRTRDGRNLGEHEN